MKVERTAKALADATGIDRKVIGSALADLRSDFMTFGDVSTAELGKSLAEIIRQEAQKVFEGFAAQRAPKAKKASGKFQRKIFSKVNQAGS